MRADLIEHDIQAEDTLAFMHIPKTGGITLGALIDPMWQPGARCPEYLTFPLARIPRTQIVQYRSFMGHFNYSALAQLLPAGFQCFTMLREPTARHLSYLRMLKRIGEYAGNQSYLPIIYQIGNPLIIQIFRYAGQVKNQETFRRWRELSLEELVADDPLQKTSGLIDGQTRQISPLRLPAGVNGGLVTSEAEEKLLASACQNLESMLGFGLLERFQETLFMLTYIFGWRPIPNSLWLNESPGKLAPELLTQEMHDRLLACNQLDLKLYTFAVDLFQRRYEWLCQTLLEKYGNESQAHQKLPLSSEIMVELLECHFRERVKKRQKDTKKAVRPIRFTFSQAVDGAFGWQRCKSSPDHGIFRWTGPGSKAVIDLIRLQGCDILLRVGLVGEFHPELVNSLQFVVNDERLSFQRCQDESGLIVYESIVPVAVAEREPFLNLVIQTTGTVSPHEADAENPDQRLLGVAVVWIEQKPVEVEE